MGTMIVGLFPDHDAIVKLTQALRTNGFEAERLRVISSDTPSDHLIRTGIQFSYSGDSEAEAIGTGGGIITGFGGMGVPGLTEHGPTLGSIRSSSSIEELLGELEIPGAKYDEYDQALDRGKTVAGYNGGSNVDTVKALFQTAGCERVDVF
ncbi:MAG: hypothetical protein JOZ50_08900 [Candidatus Eremiobacteraeota bacterium]|nr:hypothetical protein [Candidatus Eremiobacteraeota bacterium]